MLSENPDGSKSVLVHDVDQMYGTKGITKFTLYPGKAYIEITGQLYNRTSLPQTFLWWANPAVAVNENTQSIFPPDVHAVMGSRKEGCVPFPHCHRGILQKGYSEGVDISRYKNIPGAQPPIWRKSPNMILWVAMITAWRLVSCMWLTIIFLGKEAMDLGLR